MKYLLFPLLGLLFGMGVAELRRQLRRSPASHAPEVTTAVVLPNVSSKPAESAIAAAIPPPQPESVSASLYPEKKEAQLSSHEVWVPHLNFFIVGPDAESNEGKSFYPLDSSQMK